MLLFLLRSRAARRRRARRRRASELRRLHYAVIETQRQILLRASLAMSRRLLQGWRVDRALWTKRRSTAFFQDIVPGWNDQEFKGNFRVSRETFLYLVSELQLDLRKKEFLRCPVPVEQRIAIALWRLGTNVEYRTLSHLFGVGLSTVCCIVHQVCNAIVRILGPRYVRMPQGENLQVVVDGFFQRWQFPQCTGAIDGTHIKIIAPKDNPLDYWNRKQYHSIVMQALVDHQYRFMDVYIGWPGSTHDARVLANSDIYIKGEAGTLLPNKPKNICGKDVPLLFLGDPAYPLLPWMMKPYSDCGTLTARQRKFNYQLSRARFVTENAFGRLKGRWRCLLKRNDTNLKYVVQQVAACCTLHNVCEIHGDSFDDSWEVANPEDTRASSGVANQSSLTSGHDVREALATYFATH